MEDTGGGGLSPGMGRLMEPEELKRLKDFLQLLYMETPAERASAVTGQTLG